jgi:DNA-binding response OmpR family regulator
VKKPKRLLLVNGQDMFAKTLRFLLTRKGYDCTYFDNGSDAIEALEKDSYDMVITEILLEFNSGIEVLTKAKEHQQNCPIIIITGLHSESLRKQCLEAGADAYFEAPIDFSELMTAINNVQHA